MVSETVEKNDKKQKIKRLESGHQPSKYAQMAVLPVESPERS